LAAGLTASGKLPPFLLMPAHTGGESPDPHPRS